VIGANECSQQTGSFKDDGYIPEMIVVGIVSQNRVRDSSPTNSLTQYGGTKNQALNVTGGADMFIQFMLKRLEPFYQTPSLDKRRLFVATSNRVSDIYPKNNYVKQLIEKLNTKPKQGLYFEFAS